MILHLTKEEREKERARKHYLKDNDRIKDAEKRFRETNDQLALVEIYNVCYTMADKFIHSESKKKHFFIKRLDVLEKCNNVGLYILEQYLSRPTFSLQTPSAYVWLRVMRELYYRDWDAKHVLYTDKL